MTDELTERAGEALAAAFALPFLDIRSFTAPSGNTV